MFNDRDGEKEISGVRGFLMATKKRDLYWLCAAGDLVNRDQKVENDP